MHRTAFSLSLRSFLSRLLLVLLAWSAAGAGAALAAGKPFDAAAFAALQKAERPILVFIHADWCPTCKAQDPLLGELLKQPEFQSFAALKVNFDKQKKVVQGFGVRYQSTLIVFHGTREVGRSTGDTDKGSIAALMRQAL